MGWKMWVVIATIGWSALASFVGIWRGNPSPARCSDDARKINLIAFLINAFLLYAIFSSDVTKSCIVE